jgi:molybdate transport system substrate-binding protein
MLEYVVRITAIIPYTRISCSMTRFPRILSRLAFLVFLLFPLLTVAQEITVAAAADLQFVMQDVAARFEKETGIKVKLSYGSSGNFFAQLENGAPFDMFFSANVDYPKRLESDGFADPGSYYEYAVGRIVLWGRKDSQVDVSSGMQALLDPRVKKIAVANPQHAPYGQAAVAALKAERIYDKVAEKLVLGENISQTASFVVSGAADAGIVALSLAIAPTMKNKGRYVEIAASEYPPLRQACVILKASQNKEPARRFLQFLQSAATAEAFRHYGFQVPNHPAP